MKLIRIRTELMRALYTHLSINRNVEEDIWVEVILWLCVMNAFPVSDSLYRWCLVYHEFVIYKKKIKWKRNENRFRYDKGVGKKIFFHKCYVFVSIRCTSHKALWVVGEESEMKNVIVLSIYIKQQIVINCLLDSMKDVRINICFTSNNLREQNLQSWWFLEFLAS